MVQLLVCLSDGWSDSLERYLSWLIWLLWRWGKHHFQFLKFDLFIIVMPFLISEVFLIWFCCNATFNIWSLIWFHCKVTFIFWIWYVMVCTTSIFWSLDIFCSISSSNYQIYYDSIVHLQLALNISVKDVHIQRCTTLASLHWQLIWFLCKTWDTLYCFGKIRFFINRERIKWVVRDAAFLCDRMRKRENEWFS